MAHFDFGALAAPPPRTVRVNGKSIVVQTDVCGCKAGPAMVALGAGTVRVNGLGPARLGEMSVSGGGHLGQFAAGSPNVRIGGPAIVGDLSRWVKACEAAKTGRRSFRRSTLMPGTQSMGEPDEDFPDNSPWQQGNNCGLEAARMVIEEYQGSSFDEWAFMQWAIDQGFADWKKKTRKDPNTDEARRWRARAPDQGGGTLQDSDLPNVLSSNGVDSVDVHDPKRPYAADDEGEAHARVREVTSAVAEGRPVIARCDGATQTYTDEKGNVHTSVPGHIVLIVAAELDATGEPVAFFVNNTAHGGGCGLRVPTEKFTRRDPPAKGSNEFMNRIHIAPKNPPPPRR